MFSQRTGCYDTLLSLSKRMSAILNFNELVDTLVHGLVRGIPVSHAALMIHDQDTAAFVNYREETSVEDGVFTVRGSGFAAGIRVQRSRREPEHERAFAERTPNRT